MPIVCPLLSISHQIYHYRSFERYQIEKKAFDTVSKPKVLQKKVKNRNFWKRKKKKLIPNYLSGRTIVNKYKSDEQNFEYGLSQGENLPHILYNVECPIQLSR